MISDLLNTAKKTAIYSLGNLSSKVIGFILLPLYTEYLSLSEYGVLIILEASTQILIGLLGFNLTTSMMRWCASEKSLDIQKKIISSIFFTVIFIAITFSAVSIPFSNSISHFISSTLKFDKYITILLLTVSFGIISNVPMEVIRFREKAGFYVFLSASKFLVIVLLNIYFIVYQKMGVEGIILSQLIGFAYVFIASIPFLIKNLKLTFSTDLIQEMFRYGFPLIFSTSALLVLALGDRYIIKYFLSDADVGLYSLGHKVASVINIFILQSFQVGYLPIAYKKINDVGAPRYFSKVATYLIFALVLSALILSLFSIDIIKLFSLNKDYWPAYTVVPFVTLAFAFKGMQYVFSLPFHFAKKTSYIAYIVTASAAINIGLNLLFIPKYGYLVAALVMAFSYLVMSILYYILSKKYYHIPFEIQKMIKIILVGIILYIPALFITDLDILLQLLIKSFLFFSFPFILYLLNFYEPVELEKINLVWCKWKNPMNWVSNINKS